jgi:hypothetical protein
VADRQDGIGPIALDADPNRSRRLVELTPAVRRLRGALAAVLVVAAAALVDAQARTVEIVVGKTTKAEIAWAYGTPEGMSDRFFSYTLSNIGPPYPIGLKLPQGGRNLMVVFKFDERGVLEAYSFTSLPSP